MIFCVILGECLLGQKPDATTLLYAELRLPYREAQDQIIAPSPSGTYKAETSEEKRILNLLYSSMTTYSRFLGRGDNVPSASLCDVKLQQLPGEDKIYIELKLKPQVFWRQPFDDPKNRIIHQDILYTIDYLRNWTNPSRQRALGAFFSDNIELKTAGVDQDIVLIRMNSGSTGPHFPKMDEWAVRAFFSTFHILPSPRLKDPQTGGPYMFKALNRARKEMILEANPTTYHWQEADKAAPKTIIIKELSDRLPKLIAGEVDLVPEIGATALFRTELQNEFQILYSPSSSFYYIGFNENANAQTMNRLLGDEELRKISTMDWFTLLKRAYEGVENETKFSIRNNNFNKDAEVLDGPFDSSSPVELAYDEVSEAEEQTRKETIANQQIHAAKQCMQTTDHPGILAHPKIQRVIGMKQWTIIYQDFSKFSPELKDIADGLAAKLQQLGIAPQQIEVNGVRSLGQWQYRIQNKLFDFVVSYFDYGQDYDISDFISPDGSANYVKFSSRTILRHFQEFQRTQDPGTRVASLTMVHKILRDEFPGVFIIAPVKFTVYNQKRIKRLYADDNFFFSRVHQWQMNSSN